jgi:hypothetical protein
MSKIYSPGRDDKFTTCRRQQRRCLYHHERFASYEATFCSNKKQNS